MKIDIARELAVKILVKMQEESGYSNLLLDEYLQKYRQKLTVRDVNLISELVYGSVTWKLTIDTMIQKYASIKLKKISKWVLAILRISVYQIVFLDRIPKSAAVNEAVNLCKKYGMKSSKFVNAILRKIEPLDYEKFKEIPNIEERLALQYSIPIWMVRKLLQEYEQEQVEEIVKNSNQRPKITIRRNELKVDKKEFEKQLQEQGVSFENAENKKFYYLKKQKNIAKMPLFEQGFFSIQDEGAGEIVEFLEPKENEKILDACSAPGGKTTYIAEKIKNQGKIDAWDIHEHRIKLVEENAKRLGITILSTKVKDATKPEEREKDYDKILLDVPCLGTGVMKRKPDIKWQKKQEDIEKITEIQKKILTNCANLVKIQGEIVYSTCSIFKEENEDIIQWFLQKNNGLYFEKVEEKKILPRENSDGFYMCKMRRIQ